jgi:hypothetical protein
VLQLASAKCRSSPSCARQTAGNPDSRPQLQVRPLFSAVTQLRHRKTSVIETRSLYSDVELLQDAASPTIRLRYNRSVQYWRLLPRVIVNAENDLPCRVYLLQSCTLHSVACSKFIDMEQKAGQIERGDTREMVIQFEICPSNLH